MAVPKLLVKILMFPVLFVFLITLFSLIEPMITLTDIPRDSMNCPNTVAFDSVAWGNLSASDHLLYSTGCYALNWDMLVFIGLLAILGVWGWLNK